MENGKIICFTSLFKINQEVYEINNMDQIRKIGDYPLKTLVEGILTTCSKENIYTVKLCGSKIYNKKLAENIHKLAESKFNKMNIKIEVE